MKTIKAVYKMQGDMLIYYTDGNIIEYAGSLQPLHCVILCKKPFSYTAINTFGTVFTITDKSPIELLQRCEDYIASCEVEREYSSNVIKYSCGEGGI